MNLMKIITILMYLILQPNDSKETHVVNILYLKTYFVNKHLQHFNLTSSWLAIKNLYKIL